VGDLFEIFLFKNHLTRKAQIYTKASRHSVKPIVLNSWPPGVGRVKHFDVFQWEKSFEKNLFKKSLSQKGSDLLRSFSPCFIQKYFEWP
jgi:hypothetical protein